MSIRDRAAAWWSAWQFVVWLSLGLLLSLAANVWQWKRALTAPLREENKTLNDTLGTINRLASDAAEENRGLTQELAVIVERGRTDRIVYRDAAAASPLAPNCAPGKARVEAINSILGPQGPTPGVKR